MQNAEASCAFKKAFLGGGYEMVKAIPGRTVMTKRSIGQGYVNLKEMDYCPWPNKTNSKKNCSCPRISLRRNSRPTFHSQICIYSDTRHWC